MLTHDLILIACTSVVAFVAGVWYRDRQMVGDDPTDEPTDKPSRPGVTSMRYESTRKAWVILGDGTEAGAITDPDLGCVCVCFSNTVNKVCFYRPMSPEEAEDFAEAILTVAKEEVAA